MYFLQGNLFEIPQRTHFWNNTKFPNEAIRHLDVSMLVSVEGDRAAVQRWLGIVPVFHMPIFGGWKKYAVIKPVVPQDIWFVGWVVGDALGLSHIPLQHQVRLLQGNGSAQFFAVNEHGEQIQLQLVGYGEVGKRGDFNKVPLL